MYILYTILTQYILCIRISTMYTNARPRNWCAHMTHRRAYWPPECTVHTTIRLPGLSVTRHCSIFCDLPPRCGIHWHSHSQCHSLPHWPVSAPVSPDVAWLQAFPLQEGREDCHHYWCWVWVELWLRGTSVPGPSLRKPGARTQNRSRSQNRRWERRGLVLGDLGAVSRGRRGRYVL